MCFGKRIFHEKKAQWIWKTILQYDYILVHVEGYNKDIDNIIMCYFNKFVTYLANFGLKTTLVVRENNYLHMEKLNIGFGLGIYEFIPIRIDNS